MSSTWTIRVPYPPLSSLLEKLTRADFGPRPPSASGGLSRRLPLHAERRQRLAGRVCSYVRRAMGAMMFWNKYVSVGLLQPLAVWFSERPTLSGACSVIAWAILAWVFVCACVQGKEYASSSESATVYGVALGLAATFAWLGVEEEGPYEGRNGDGVKDPKFE